MDSISVTTLEKLSKTVQRQQETVHADFAQLDMSLLNYKVSSESWSILECLEHLNRYCAYYLPVLEKAISHNLAHHTSPEIKYSWIGRKSLEMVRPENRKMQKTFKHMNPNNSQLSRATLNAFLKYQDELLLLLDKAKTTNLNKKAVPLEFFKLLKMRIGEALEFMILHQERHLQQALRVKQRQADLKSS